HHRRNPSPKNRPRALDSTPAASARELVAGSGADPRPGTLDVVRKAAPRQNHSRQVRSQRNALPPPDPASPAPARRSAPAGIAIIVTVILNKRSLHSEEPVPSLPRES